MLALKLSAKCKTLEELIATLDRASTMISMGCKLTTRNNEGTAAFGFEVNYDDETEWVTSDELEKTVALEFDKLNP